MAANSLQRSAIWKLAREQHGVISRQQLHELGLSMQGIRQRLARGRLHELFPGVYAVGRPEVSQHGRFLAAVLACGPGAVLSHFTASELWGIHRDRRHALEASVDARCCPKAHGIRLHRRYALPPSELTRHRNIPVTSPALTIVDIAPRVSEQQLEAAINEADKLDLIDPEHLRERLEELPRIPGRAVVRRLLDRDTFLLTDSEMERRFLRIVREAGLPTPVTGAPLNGYRVDFHWPNLGLIVETDGLRYHRTLTQQSRDRLRDQAHARAGLTTLRFTHAQIRHQPGEVRDTLGAVATRLVSAEARR